MKLLDNFLTSGHQFSEDEYELKTKFSLLNSIAFVSAIAVLILTIIQIRQNVFTLINLVFIAVDIGVLILLRYKKYLYSIAAYVLILTALIILTAFLLITPDVFLRVLWFFFIIAFSFLVAGKKAGFILFVVSLIEIIIFFSYVNTKISSHSYFLIIILVILLSFIIGLYEQREESIKKKLYELNNTLEYKVKKETQKLVEQKNAYQKLAYYDSLTGLPNRILFNERLNFSIKKSKRYKTKLAVLFIDLDHFKDINDLFGHPAGDEVLKQIAERIQKHLRASDTLSRLGGDEFALILEELKEDSNAGAVAQNLRRVVAEPLHMNGHELFVTVSIGISIYPKDSTEADDLVKCADTAMYSAKKDGRNLSHFYKAKMTDQLLEHLTMETYIRRGIENDEFVVYYQPLVDAASGRWVGLEALIRWEHPEQGLVGPDKFIPVAEASSLIVSLGGIVLAQVARDMQRWHEQGVDPDRVSVNLSVKQLTYRSLVPVLRKILRRVSFRENWLELEITESYTFQKPDEAIALLHQIRELGIRLAIDDFGTGYSSLAYLKKLPVNKLKIDRVFVKDIPGNEEDETMVRTIISMAKNLNLDVVAEGVESVEQKDFLRQNGCLILQGYLYSRPVPSEIITKKLLQKGEFKDG